MANRRDWIPTQEEKLIELMLVWQAKLADASLQAAYEWPADECTIVENGFTAFSGARTVYQAAPTKANRIEKDGLKKAAVDAMRKFAREKIRVNGKMNDGQKQELGFTVQDKAPSPVPVPDAGPDSEAVISAREPGMVKVKYLGAKPYGVDRVEIAFSISETVIDSPDQLTNHETFSRNPWERTFAHEDRAKKMYYSLRYLTKEGASHWSDVREVVVP
ncbi:hypothetical protein AGMMS50212_11170 [Spirochaetia bacterium]|nr:hypothetical protein AGMMS50212_11170 [Spirochaetia bacterium]